MKEKRLTEIALIKKLGTLIEIGEDILNKTTPVAPVYHINSFSGERSEFSPGYNKIDHSRFVEWKTQIVSILCHIIPESHLHFHSIKSLMKLTADESSLIGAIAFAKGIKGSLENGFLNSLFTQIEAEVAADYIGMAERMLLESSSERFHYVPAAMLTGAVLEKSLKDLCSKKEAPISILNNKGNYKTLGPLIEDLKKVGAFNELTAKQLRVWAEIRNSAAHGQFESFCVADVEQMIQAVTRFLAESSD
jgi:hypothetical protein